MTSHVFLPEDEQLHEDYLLPPYSPKVRVPAWDTGARLGDSWAALGAIVSGRYDVGALTKAVRKLLNVGHMFAFSSGGSALTAGFMASGLQSGDEVIIPSYLCSRVADAALSAGLRPCLVDVGPDHSVFPAAVRKAIGRRTRAVVAAHLYGQPCDMGALAEITSDHDLLLVDDAAQALGASFEGKPVGGLGDFGVLSFGPGKVPEGIGGGCLVTDRDDIASRVPEPAQGPGRIGSIRRGLRCALERRTRRVTAPYRYWKRRNTQRAYAEHYRDRPRARIAIEAMDSLQGRVAIASLAGLREEIEAGRLIAQRLSEGLKGCEGILLPAAKAGRTYPGYPIVSVAVHRHRVCMELARQGIETIPPYYPLHLQRAYCPPARTALPLSMSERAFRGLVILPVHRELEAHLGEVADAIRTACGQGRLVDRAFAERAGSSL